MRKILSVIGLGLCLAGCSDGKAEKEAWIKNCDGAFTPKQCEILYSMKHDSDENASTNMALTGAAIGVAAGNMGARR